MRRSTLPIILLTALAAGAPAAAQPAPEASAAAKVLLDQANYWLSKDQPNQAQQALTRLLRVDPRNPDALALQAQLQAGGGDRAGAQASIAALRAGRPDDPRLPALEHAVRAGAIDQAGLAEARQLARQGRGPEATARYQTLFRGAPPPDPLGVEYYQTLATTTGGWDAARDGLARLAADPHNLRAQLAYAELLTYRPPTRADGIARLAALAQEPSMAAEATKAWRQALEWLPADGASIPAYEAFLGRQPDQGIAQRLQAARNPPVAPQDALGRQRSAGFAALNAGKLAEADLAFRAELAQNPDDAAALGGLGLVKLRQNDTQEARALLGRAIAADPAGKARWEQTLAGASVGEEYERARAMIRRGQLDDAERALRAIIASGGDTGGAQAMLADVQARRGDLAGAEATWRAVLARRPNNPDSLLGLAQVLNREGRGEEASALLDRAESSGSSAAARMRGEALRQRAAAMSHPMEKVALLRAANQADPSDPWIRLDLARALAAAGQKAEARSLMASAIDGPRPSVDALRAAALFAAEDGRLTEAAAMTQRLPASARGPELQGLFAQAQVQGDISSAMAMYAVSPMAARQKLLSIAAQPDPDGGRGVAVAHAFTELHDPRAAREALAVAQAATLKPAPQQRIAYAGALLSAGDDAGARMMVASLEGTPGLTPAQRQALVGLRMGIAIRASDALSAEGRPADAYDQLAPLLAQYPNDPALNLAMARLYQGNREPTQALAIASAVLARDPIDMQARRAAVGAAIQARDWDRAGALARDGVQIAPNDPTAWLIAAELARAEGNDRRALEDLRTARSLREQQLGGAGAALPGSPVRIVALQSDTAMPASNPFRADQPAPDPVPGSLQPGRSADPLAGGDATLRDIDRQISTVRNEIAPRLSLGPGVRMRTGTTGLDQLNDVTVPLELLVVPFGRGRATFTATPTFLNAGSVPLDVQDQASFGTGAFGGSPPPGNQTAQGVGLSAAYDLAWFHGDVGSTPLGFLLGNVVGGVELSPMATDTLRLRARLEQRAVTDSLLSYAGTRDPGTGTVWGGVTRRGGHGQAELSVGDGALYAGGGYYSLTGTSVASNSMYELGGGLGIPVWRRGGDEIQLGLDLVYFAYDKNLRFFSLGQGGYFSPQSYFASLVPLSFTSKGENLTWSLGGSIGYQTYREDSSPVFPNNPGLQAALVASPGPALLTAYPGKTASGIAGRAQGMLEYRVNPSLSVGARAGYQYTGDWSQFTGTVFARYIFNGDTW